MAEPFPLFGADAADAREMAMECVLAPVAGWVFAHHPGTRRVLLHLDASGVRLSAEPPRSLEDALQVIFGTPTPTWDLRSWNAAFAGFPGGLLAVATPLPAPKSWAWRSRAQIGRMWGTLPEPPPRAPAEISPDVAPFWEDLATLDHLERLIATLSALHRQAEEVRDPRALDDGLLRQLEGLLSRNIGE